MVKELNGVKRMRLIVFFRCMGIAGLIVLLTACSMFGGGQSNKTKGADQKQQKAQSTAKPSIIDQELHKQYNIYKEIIQYQIEQDKKAIKQTEERNKKMKAQSDKQSSSSSASPSPSPSPKESGKPSTKKQSGGKSQG